MMDPAARMLGLLIISSVVFWLIIAVLLLGIE